MNWDAAGAIGEIVGALAVVVTLGYLAVQVRSAREVAADSNRLNRTNNVLGMALALATHPDLLRNMNKAQGITPYYESYAEQFDLDADQAGSVDWVHCHTFWMHWGQYSSSTSPGDLDEIANIVSGFYRNPAVRYSWDHSPFAKPMLDPNFVEFVEHVLKTKERAE